MGDFTVTKRNGEITDFNLSKISDAIRKAFIATDKLFSEDIISLLALRVTSEFQKKIVNRTVTVEDIQDSVEEVLNKAGYNDVAKAYILYRKKREKIRNMKSTILDYKDIVDSYVKEDDWQEKGKSKNAFSIGGLIMHNSGSITANYWLSEIYDYEIATAHRNGDIHIHDLEVLTAYSSKWSLRRLVKEGIGRAPGRITCLPAKHLLSLCNQIVDFLRLMQNEWSGMQLLSSFDTLLAPFVKVDKLSYLEVKQCIQSLIFGLNMPCNCGTHASFSKISFDWTVPADLADMPCIVGGEELSFCYRDCKDEMDMVNRAFLEVMLEGDPSGRGFQYPIPEYLITEEFDWSDTESNQLLFELSAKYGSPCFINGMNDALHNKNIDNTGSIGVVSINLPRIAYQSANEQEFFRRLDKMMDVSARTLKVKRQILIKLLDEGLYPYTKKFIFGFSNYYSTISIIGMNEAGLNACWIGKDLSCTETIEFSERVLKHMENRLSEYQDKYGDLYNIEDLQDQLAGARLAEQDKKVWPNIISAGINGDVPYYTSSTNLPADYTSNVFAALDIQDRLLKLFSSGTVFHIYLAERLLDWKIVAKLIKHITMNYSLPCITLSPTYTICEKHGYIRGESFKCPACGADAEVFSRFAWEYSAIQTWNDGKFQEYNNRNKYIIDEDIF